MVTINMKYTLNMILLFHLDKMLKVLEYMDFNHDSYC